MEQPPDKAEISIALSKDYAYYINPTPTERREPSLEAVPVPQKERKV